MKLHLQRISRSESSTTSASTVVPTRRERFQHLALWASRLLDCAGCSLKWMLPEPWPTMLEVAAVLLEVALVLVEHVPAVWATRPKWMRRVNVRSLLVHRLGIRSITAEVDLSLSHPSAPGKYCEYDESLAGSDLTCTAWPSLVAPSWTGFGSGPFVRGQRRKAEAFDRRLGTARNHKWSPFSPGWTVGARRCPS